MKSITISKRASAVLGAAVAATLSAGIASAVWTSPTGTGNGSATGYTAIKADVTARTTNTAEPLFPGSSVTNTVTITNPNPYPIKVTAITPGSGNAAGGLNSACLAGTVNVTGPASNAAGLPQNDVDDTVAIPANGTGTYDVTVTMASTANNACQGLTFTLPVTISSESSSF